MQFNSGDDRPIMIHAYIIEISRPTSEAHSKNKATAIRSPHLIVLGQLSFINGIGNFQSPVDVIHLGRSKPGKHHHPEANMTASPIHDFNFNLSEALAAMTT